MRSAEQPAHSILAWKVRFSVTMKSIFKFPSSRRIVTFGVFVLFTTFSSRTNADTLITGDTSMGDNKWSWLGVLDGKEVRFYRYTLGGKAMLRTSFETLALPAVADEIISSGDRLGVRTGRRLRFFDINRNFLPLPRYDFELPEGISRLLLADNRLGILTNRTLRFYDISSNYRHLPAYDFDVPGDTAELEIAINSTGAWLGLRRRTNLTFYNIDKNYEPEGTYSFSVPLGTEEIEISGMLLLVRRGDMITFHDFGKKIITTRRHKMVLGGFNQPKLESLRGTSLTFLENSDTGIPARIWAKGDSMRTETSLGGRKIVSIQRGDTCYTFDDNSPTGTKEWLGEGLAARGLINQIAEVKANGMRWNVEEQNGAVYQGYRYEDSPDAMTMTYLSTESSLPWIWISMLNRGGGETSTMRAYYRDLEANVAIPEALFELPERVRFSE